MRKISVVAVGLLFEVCVEYGEVTRVWWLDQRQVQAGRQSSSGSTSYCRSTNTKKAKVVFKANNLLCEITTTFFGLTILSYLLIEKNSRKEKLRRLSYI